MSRHALFESFRNSVAHRLIFFSVAFSSLITLIGTGYQLYQQFSIGIGTVERTFSQINTSYLNSLEQTLWVADREQLQVLLQGILALPDIEKVVLTSKDGFTLSLGETPEAGRLEDSYVIRHTFHDEEIMLGSLQVTATLEHVYARLWDQGLIILATQFTKTFLVTTFMFFLFQVLVGRHLAALSSQVGTLDLRAPSPPFHLKRKGVRITQDELGQLTSALNTMKNTIVENYSKIQRVQLALQKDILKRKQVEQERDRFIELSPDLLSVTGHDGFFKQIGPNWESVLGWSTEELLSKAWLDFVHPEDIESTRAAGKKAQHEGSIRNFVNRYRCKDDRYRWLAWNTVAGGDGLFFSITRDITEERETERSLEQSEQRIRQVVSSAPLILFALDEEGVFTLSEGRGLSDLNLRPGEVVGQSVFDVYAEFPDVLALVRRALKGETISGDLFVGETRWSVHYWPSLNAVGALIGTTGVALGITELMRAHEALQISERRYAALFNTSRDGISFLNLDGRLEEVNPAYAGMLGYTPQSLIGRSYLDLTPDPWRGGFAAAIAARIRECGDSGTYEKEYIRRDGTVFPVEARVWAVADESGAPQRLMAICRDITEKKRIENELARHREDLENLVSERTAKLEETNAELEAFVHSLSHDLQSPLRTMSGFAEALREDYGTALDVTAQDYAARIVGGAQRLQNLIEDLLGYSNLSRQELRLELVDTQHIVTQILESLSAEIHEKHAQIELIEPLPPVYANTAVLSQVFLNLLSNALKFVPPGESPRIRIHSETLEGRARLWVEDQGIGIPQTQIENVFGLFERLHGIEAYPGTGIGLALVMRGVARMHGQAGVVSKVGCGSRFWVELGTDGILPKVGNA